MKARLKIDYRDMKKGDIINVQPVSERFVTCNGVDFGWSEIEVCGESMFELGKYITMIDKTEANGYMRQNAITAAAKSVIPALTTSVKVRALNRYIYA
jgi:hypothetical protein